MLDNLRNQPGDQPIFIEEETPKEESTADFLEVKPKPPKRRRTFDQLTGTTALQRFILAVMLFVMVCLAGTALLVLTGKVIPNFLF